MKIATSWSVEADTVKAVSEAYKDILLELGDSPPSCLILSITQNHDLSQIQQTLAKLAPQVPVHGTTTCQAVLTASGYHSEEGSALGLLAIADAVGDYGTALTLVDPEAPREAGREAILQAIEHAERFGEPPDLVWVNSVPGYEEQVLLGIQDVIGTNVPIAGGSSADNAVAGQWQQFTNQTIAQNGVVVTVMYPSTKVHVAFHSGYSPTQTKGIVTRSSGRTLYEIDHQPAAQVYNQWLQGGLSAHLEAGGNILGDTSLYPLGRFVGQLGDITYHRLSHPETVTADGALTLFSNIEDGDELILMEGTQESLLKRAGRVASTAMMQGRMETSQIAGALLIYCAGCMLTVQDKMDMVSEGMNEALAGAPFLGTFTFGEQGCFLGGESHHGNLMISVVVFANE